MIIKKIKFLCLGTLLVMTFDVGAQFKPLSYMTSIFSRVVYCCNPQTWKDFLFNRFGWISRAGLDQRVQVAERQLTDISNTKKRKIDSQFNQLQGNLNTKLELFANNFSGQLQGVQKNADQGFNEIEGTIQNLHKLVQNQQKTFAEELDKQSEKINVSMRYQRSKYTLEFNLFKQQINGRNQEFLRSMDDLQEGVESINGINEGTLQIVENIQRPLTKDQRTMFKQTLQQFEEPSQQPKRLMGAAAALSLALIKNK